MLPTNPEELAAILRLKLLERTFLQIKFFRQKSFSKSRLTLVC
jgi:hypothetical protein